jgi:hypothetical protein
MSGTGGGNDGGGGGFVDGTGGGIGTRVGVGRGTLTGRGTRMTGYGDVQSGGVVSRGSGRTSGGFFGGTGARGSLGPGK